MIEIEEHEPFSSAGCEYQAEQVLPEHAELLLQLHRAQMEEVGEYYRKALPQSEL